uniref:Uncharacterized protein n=1 Tax=Panagrellus redivivus TaxID=6233 RepID=A0A7E4W5B0_PANRE
MGMWKPIFTGVNFGQLRKDDFKFSYILEMFVHNPNPHCGLYLTPIYGQPVMNILHQDSPKTQTKRNADDGGEEGEESNATETEEATPTSASVKAASTPSIVWVYIIIGITALISLVALPFVIRILYLELCRKNKNNPPPAAAAPVAANGSGQLAGAPADMSGKGAEMSNATDNGSKDPFVKEESKKKPQTPQKQAFIGPVRKEREPSAKKPKETKPSQETANVATARPSIVPPSYVLDDENRIPIHKRICEILPTRRRLQRGSDDMHRMAMVEEDSDKRHDYLNEAIHQAELEIDWVFNDHNTKDKKNKSPPKVDDLSHIGKRIIEARRRHIRPPIQCRKGEFRNEYLFAYDYAQVYDFALIEEYDLKARYFYFEYGLSEVKNRFEEWTKNKAIFDPCSVDPLVLQYDLALEEKQKNYNGELSQVGWDSSPIVHHAKRTKETIVPPTGTPAPPTEKGVKADK